MRTADGRFRVIFQKAPTKPSPGRVNTENLGAVAFWENAGFDSDSHDGRWSLVL